MGAAPVVMLFSVLACIAGHAAADEDDPDRAGYASDTEAVLPDRVRFRALHPETGQAMVGVDWTYAVDDTVSGALLVGGRWLVLDSRPGTYRVGASRGAFAGNAMVTIAPGSPSDHDVTMELMQAQLILQAVDEASGEPLTAVEWRLLDLASGQRRTVLVGGGDYSAILAPGRYRVEARRDVRVGAAEITLESGSTVSHAIQLGAGSGPETGAVEIRLRAREPEAQPEPEALTVGDGPSDTEQE